MACALSNRLWAVRAGLEGGWGAAGGERSPGRGSRLVGKDSSAAPAPTHTHTPKTMQSKTLDEGRRVGHGHGAVIWDREQLICRHGDPVPGGAVGEGDVGQAEDVQLSVRQMLSENWRRQS